MGGPGVWAAARASCLWAQPSPASISGPLWAWLLGGKVQTGAEALS